MVTSILSKVKSEPVPPVSQASSFKLSPLTAVQQNPLVASQNAQILATCVIDMKDIEELGEDISKQIGTTTDKIIKKMSVGNFDELGEILTAVQLEASKLDPASYGKPGIIGWLKGKFTDVKKELTLNFKTAEDVFDKLEKQISNHMAVHGEWIKDLDTLYKENYTRYQTLMQTIHVAGKWEEHILLQLKNWPEIDPTSLDAPMKLQERRDVENLLNRLRIKMDYFLRLKTVLENHSPRIRDQQETSRTTISTLKDVVEQAIPAIKSEFTMFLQSLDSKKSNELIGNLRGLVNTTLQKSADTAKDAALQSATNANTPTFSTDTIQHIRTRMLETVIEVKRINQEGATKRAEDAKYIQDSQQEYYKQCVQLGAIK